MGKESYLDGRVEYMEGWLLSLSEQADRASVVDEESAEEFIKKVLAKDSSLANFIDGVEKQRPGDLRTLVQGDFIQGLIEENSDGIPKVLVQAKVRKRDVRITKARSLASVVGSADAALRQKVLRTIYNPVYRTPTDDHVGLRSGRTGKFVSKARVRVAARLGVVASLDRKMRPLYRDARSGRFVSQQVLFRRANGYLLTHPKRRAEVERLLRRERVEEQKL